VFFCSVTPLQKCETRTKLTIAAEFWNEVAEHIPDWKLAKQRKVSAADLRRDYIHAHTLALVSLGRTGNELIRRHPRDWKSKLGSMEAMIKNDEEKVWMTPLLELRNELDNPDDRSLRDFRRMNGHVQLFHDRTIPGPYTKASREHWLRRVLEAQEQARGEGPPEFRNLKLITMDELHEIRRIWLNEKHEFDDSLPRIFQEVTGQEKQLGLLKDDLERLGE
jgi:hypothetical protein